MLMVEGVYPLPNNSADSSAAGLAVNLGAYIGFNSACLTTARDIAALPPADSETASGQNRSRARGGVAGLITSPDISRSQTEELRRRPRALAHAAFDDLAWTRIQSELCNDWRDHRDWRRSLT